MNTKVIRPEHFERALLEALTQYGDVVAEKVEPVTKNTARQTVSAIKGSAPSGGRYARGWSHKQQKGGALRFSDTVYNRTDYQLTHLLEKPHDTGRGGHYPKKVDYTGTLAKIETEFTARFMEEVIAKL